MRSLRQVFESGTLREKLLRWVLMPMVVLLLLNVALIYKLGHDSADRRHDRFLSDISKILLDQLRTNDDGVVEFNLHSGALNMLSADNKDQVYFLLQGWQEDFEFGHPDLPLPGEKIGDRPVYYLANYAGRPVRMMAAIIPETDVHSGKVLIIVGKTLVLHDERALEWIWRILPQQLLLMLLTVIFLWFGVDRAMKPLSQLRDEVKRRSSLDLSPLPEEGVLAEIRPLIHGFNELLGRLDASFALKRRFIADASHQLRTPLAGLKAQAELALSLQNEDEIRHSLEQMRKAADHASHLANQLLLLARSEPGSQDQVRELDFVVLSKTTTEEWVPAALHKNIDLGFECEGKSCRMRGNAVLLGEMLNNLLDNAIRYTPENGRVTARVTVAHQTVTLEVEDDGPGVPEQDRERVFERFYRVLGTNQDGCGLGLAIVREIAYQHHAKLSLHSGENGVGTLIRVVFARSPNLDVGELSGSYHAVY